MKHRNYNPVTPISPITITKEKQQEHSQIQDDIINFIEDGGIIMVYNTNGRIIGAHANV